MNNTRPSGVETRTAAASGMEWVTWMNSIPKGPTCVLRPGSMRWTFVLMRCSSSLDCANAAVSCRAWIGGALRPSSRNNHGSAPT